MDKEWMLMQARDRLRELKEKKKRLEIAFVNNTCATKNGNTSMRSKIQRDICMLKLIVNCLEHSKQFYIEDEEAEQGFDRLVNPQKK